MPCYQCKHANRDTAQFCANCGAPLQLQNKYRILRLLGRGGYSSVYEAEHTRLGGARYAIKELFHESHLTPAQRQTASEQFSAEASILAHLSYPMLPKVMDFFTERGRDYLVMEFIPGDTLEEYLAKTNAPLPEAQVLKWADELCDALIYLHSQNPPVIHRDIKPSNIKITPDGKLKLLDFGISKLLNVGAKTGTAARAGTPPYTPLEQYGTGTDERSDIYALGVVMYEMLTTRKPPEAPDRSRIAVIPPRQLNPSISASTEMIVLKAMAEKPKERFQSAREIQQAIRNPASQVRTAQLAAANSMNASAVNTPTLVSRPAALPLWLIPVGVILILVLGFLTYSFGESNARSSATASAQFAFQTRAVQSIATDVARAQTNATETSLVARGTVTANASVTNLNDIASATAEVAQRTSVAQESVRATATANAVRTALAQATAISRTELINAAKTWTNMLYDNFDSNVNNWPDTTANGDCQVLVGVYRCLISTGYNFTWWRWIDPRLPDTFSLSLDVEILGNDPAEAGLQFQRVENDHYLFKIGNDQSLEVGYYDAKRELFVPFIEGRNISAIRPEQPNRLTVIGNGSEYIILVNEHDLGGFRDSKLRDGRFGVYYKGDAAAKPILFTFDDLELRAP